MNVTKETVTPKKAMEWLKRNIANRPLSPALATRWGNAMRAKRWMLNGETIKFNGNGDLIDGQHRLTGCIESGCPFETYVVRGLPHEAFDSLDQGKKRSGGDVLARRGEKNYNMLASAALIARNIEDTRALDNGYSMRPDQIVEYLESHGALRECCVFANVNNADRLVPHSIVAALLYLFRTVDAAKADVFWSRILTGENVTKNMVEFRMRSRLIENKAAAAKLRRTPLCALIIKTWNSAVSGRDLKVIRWADDEAFPLINNFKYPQE